MFAPDHHPFAPVFTPLLAAHTPDGRYVELDGKAFRQIGVDAAALLGRFWQDFAPGADVDNESRAIRCAIARERPVALPKVIRSWSGRPIQLAVTVSVSRSRGGVLMILRHALVVAARAGTPQRAEESGPMAALRSTAGLG